MQTSQPREYFKKTATMAHKQLSWMTLLILLFCVNIFAQTPPTPNEIKHYDEFFIAVVEGNLDAVQQHIESGIDIEQRDNNGRTALLIASHYSHDHIAERLLLRGADSNAMDMQHYDMITIAAVNNDVDLITLGLRFDARPDAITSPYQGTALIAAAHLGHVETVNTLINAGAPLDHVNNLGWTALIESIVLGDGGLRHIEVLKLLIKAGADITLSDQQEQTPLQLAKQYGFSDMVKILKQSTE